MMLETELTDKLLLLEEASTTWVESDDEGDRHDKKEELMNAKPSYREAYWGLSAETEKRCLELENSVKGTLVLQSYEDATSVRLARALHQSTTIQHLDICETVGWDAKASHLFSLAIHNHSSLSKVTFHLKDRNSQSIVAFGDEFDSILPSLATCQKLVSISVPFTGSLGSKFGAGLAHLVEKSNSLQHFQMEKCEAHRHLQMENCSGLLDFKVLASLVKVAKLKNLSLYNPAITTNNYQVLSSLNFSEFLDALAQDKTIESLLASRYMAFFEQHLEPTKTFFCQNSTVTKLTMEYCIDGSMMEELEEALSQNKALKSLIIYPCGDKIMGVVTRVLTKEHMPLENLVLSSTNGLTSSSKPSNNGFFMLARVLTINKSLRVVDVSDNAAKESGWLALGRSLQVNHTLEKLYLIGGHSMRQNLPSTKGLEEFADALGVNQTLKSIRVGDGQVCVGHLKCQPMDTDSRNVLSKIDMLLQCNNSKDFALKQSYLEDQKNKQATALAEAAATAGSISSRWHSGVASPQDNNRAQIEPQLVAEDLQQASMPTSSTLCAKQKNINAMATTHPTCHLSPAVAATTQCDACCQNTKKGLSCESPEGLDHFVCASCLEAVLEDNLGKITVPCPYSRCPKQLSIKHDLYGKVSAFHYEMHCVAKHHNNEMAQRILELEKKLKS